MQQRIFARYISRIIKNCGARKTTVFGEPYFILPFIVFLIKDTFIRFLLAL